MRRREQGWTFGGASDLWRVEPCPLHGRMYDTLIRTFCEEKLTRLHRYINTVTGEQQPEPPPDFRGGVIADQMGLGKSLSIIAMIARDKDDPFQCPLPPAEVSVPATLIVVRAPCECDRVWPSPALMLIRLPVIHTWDHQLHT